MHLLDELRRRNVIRMAGLYLVGAWLITQVSSTVLPMFDAPVWLPRSVVILLAIGFVPALIFAWVFELTPDVTNSTQAIENGPRCRLPFHRRNASCSRRTAPGSAG